ncbi:MAG: DUF1801 domain-containing protein [Candidatus Micrarchaeota archaeon]|nr:DUF1801 domain-containing protein [Candidatus Micrarchaeota archaeon]
MRVRAKSVDSYIGMAPKAIQPKLRQVRSAIRQTVPKAGEGIGYSMPYYYREDEGLSWQQRSIVWFALQSGHIGLYLPPPIIAEHKKELKGYVTTKSAVHIPLDKPIPVALIKKLVRARLRKGPS